MKAKAKRQAMRIRDLGSEDKLPKGMMERKRRRHAKTHHYLRTAFMDCLDEFLDTRIEVIKW